MKFAVATLSFFWIAQFATLQVSGKHHLKKHNHQVRDGEVSTERPYYCPPCDCSTSATPPPLNLGGTSENKRHKAKKHQKKYKRNVNFEDTHPDMSCPPCDCSQTGNPTEISPSIPTDSTPSVPPQIPNQNTTCGDDGTSQRHHKKHGKHAVKHHVTKKHHASNKNHAKH